jgi:hypothetical protein
MYGRHPDPALQNTKEALAGEEVSLSDSTASRLGLTVWLRVDQIPALAVSVRAAREVTRNVWNWVTRCI